VIYFPPLHNRQLANEYDDILYDDLGSSLYDLVQFYHAYNGVSAGLLCDWLYWGEPKIPIAMNIETYGNSSALVEFHNGTSGLIELTGVWDFFNPSEAKILANCRVISIAMLHIMQLETKYFQFASKSPNSPILYVGGAFGGLIAAGSVALYILSKRRKNLSAA